MRIGIDLGGTKIEGIVMDASGLVLERKRVVTPSPRGYENILTAIVDLVADLESGYRNRCTVGIGTPGAISARTGTLKNSNTLSLNGKRIRQDLEDLLQREKPCTCQRHGE